MVIVAVGVVITLLSQSSGPPSTQSSDTRTWHAAYEDARKAIEQKNWLAAIANLEHALRTQKPGRNIRTYGSNFLTFNPDYYFGVAYLNLGRFAEADAAFERAQSVITSKDPEWRAFQTESKRAAFEHQMQLAQERISARDFKGAMERIDRAKPYAVGAEISRVDTLRGEIVQAQAEAKPGPTGPARGQPDAGAGTNPTPTLPVGTGGAPNLGGSVGFSTPANPGPANPAAPGGSGSQSGKSSTRGTTAGTQGNRTFPGGTPNPPATPPADPDKSRGTTTTPPADPEQSALTKFFSGDYAAAVNEFRPLASGAYSSQRHQFFLACSIAARVLSGGAERATLEEARQLYARLSGPRDQFSAELTFISPRILQALEGK